MSRAILHLRFSRPTFETYRELFAVLGDVSPVVQALPPDSALMDVTGALKYFRRTPADLADLLQTRLLARYGLHTAIGAGPTRSQRVRRFLRQIRPEVAGQSALDLALVHRVRAGSAVGRGMHGTGWARGERSAEVVTAGGGRWSR